MDLLDLLELTFPYTFQSYEPVIRLVTVPGFDEDNVDDESDCEEDDETELEDEDLVQELSGEDAEAVLNEKILENLTGREDIESLKLANKTLIKLASYWKERCIKLEEKNND